ncbi:putative feruloyl esterase B-2-like protein 2 [Colletotrichum chlorophyti]|uniref:Carboxylic ester hydrolase n=1 Tax=Colletotrichum chlorophyti TaxID=708187 RepID=A0A1Q8S6M5_9PEZI|nr:putative feruloyl esterase B-2-like protein 2 [Colletotrichum chlorophyti]
MHQNLHLTFTAFLTFSSLSLSAFQDECLALKPESMVMNSTLKSATDLTFPEQDASCNRASQVVRTNLCRVMMNLTTSERSQVATEVWLPEKWNGRIVTVGGGGIDGCVHTEDLAYATAHGFAAVGTNNGHAGTIGVQFLNNEDVVTDFSWRALHAGVVAGKQLLQPLYKRRATGSYFLGCSLGGRQGIQAAEMFPQDFDGIIAGAPAVDFNNLYSHRASYFSITGAVDSKDFIAPTVWKSLIHNEVMKQCDKIDGVEDGIIEDPTLCEFDPVPLLCRDSTTNDKTKCLTSAQVGIVKQIYGPTYYANGSLFWLGMNPGSEVKAADGLYSGKPFAYSQNWFRYAVYSDPEWNSANYALHRDGVYAEQLNPGNIRTFPYELSAFKNRGGKLLMYHGQQDHQITSFQTPRFYERLAQGMGLDYEMMDQFVRLFRISGMSHCASGPGAWILGQGGAAAGVADSLPFDRTHNVLAAIVDWVEVGVAPESITGTKFINDTVKSGVDFKRQHCKYPLRSKYRGNGLDPKDINSWNCSCGQLCKRWVNDFVFYQDM